MNIAFHVNQFTYRGSEVALFDYAVLNIHKLNNKSIIVYPKNSDKNELVFEKFNKYFNTYAYSSDDDLRQFLSKNNVKAIYFIVYGTNQGVSTIDFGVPSLVHCVFTTSQPHGKVYAGVSKSVSTEIFQFVNHLVHLPDIDTDYRKKLGIPKNAIVFGRHGGQDTFNIDWVKDAILKLVEERDDVYFLFAVKPYVFSDVNHPRIMFFPSFVDKRIKTKFINTCDAMIHACSLGESFGLSVLEFTFRNKPVITWNGGMWHKQHLSNLGDKAILYNNKEELLDIFRKFNPNDYKNIDYKSLCEPFNADNIALKFKNVFLDKL